METLQLPTTSYIILGMLTYREMSGYDIKQLLEKSIRHFYTIPAKSQIYAELRRLESLGYATVHEIPQTRRPDKWLYRITQKGREEMRRWLAATTVPPDVYKSPLLLKLFFGHLASHEDLRAMIAARQRQLQQDLSRCEEQEADLHNHIHGSRQEEDLKLSLLVLQHATAQVRADLEWTDMALAQLQALPTDAAPGQNTGSSNNTVQRR
jgi:DNA-binding PadR family transcriptional regulator